MSLKGKTDIEKFWNYFKAKGLTDYGIAGLLGNIYCESGIIPNRLETLCKNRLKEYYNKTYTDESYTKEIDEGKITKERFLNPIPDKKYGYGLCQWTSVNRKSGLYDLAKSKGVSIGDLEMQLDYLYKELSTSYKTVLNTLKTATTVKQASDIVLTKFECPANITDTTKKKRADIGQSYFDKYKSETVSNSTNKVSANVSTKGESNMNYNIQQVITIAKNEIGYLEKKSSSNLDSKTGNAGSNNYTKYWKEMADLGLGNYQAQYWCACFVSWCFYKAYGLAAMQKLLLHKFFISCSKMATLASNAKQLYSTPKVGDVILFHKSSGYYHTGLVIEVTSSTITTIEGNTSGGSTVVRNGGGVAKKTYKRSSLDAKFMRPDYGTAPTTTTTTTSSSSSSSGTKLNKTQKWVGKVDCDVLNVRTWAGTSNPKLKSYPSIKKGKTVGVCDTVKDKEGTNWYYICIDNKVYGFVSSKYIIKK